MLHGDGDGLVGLYRITAIWGQWMGYACLSCVEHSIGHEDFFNDSEELGYEWSLIANREKRGIVEFRYW